MNNMDDTIKLLNEEEKEANDRLKSVTLKEYKSMNKEQSLIDGVLSKFEAITDYLKGYKPSQMRAILGLVIGTNVQAYDADTLTASNTKTLTNKTINGLKLATVSKSADYTLTSADDVCIVTASCTITLPAVASSAGKVFVIKANTGGITSIVIDGNASETIDGATTKTIATDLSTVTIVCTGSAWFIHSYYVGGAL